MDLSRRNRAEARANAAEDAASHLLTLDLSRAEMLATMVAHSRASSVVEIADLVAGMYLYDWDRFAKYWEYDDHERVESLLRTMCRISPERWNYWIEFYDKKRRGEEKAISSLPFLRKFQKAAVPEPRPRYSAELMAVLKKAEEIAPFRDTSGNRSRPILTSECVLLCIVRSRQTEISRRLAASGMKVPDLERDALSSRRAPREE